MMLGPLKCICRRQFDIANREAMDESAEWRQKYDWEVDRANKCVKELQVVCVLLEYFHFLPFSNCMARKVSVQVLHCCDL